MTQAKADQAWGLFQSLMRQYPLWPSTFSICECGRADARGSGKCALCIKEELAGIAGIFIVDRAEKAMKQVAGPIKLELAQFRALEAFAAFASDLDKASQQQLSRGRRLVELLKQPQYSPLKVEEQVVSIFAATNGYLDQYPEADVRRFEGEFLSYLRSKHPAVLSALAEKKAMSDDIKKNLATALKEFTAIFTPSQAK